MTTDTQAAETGQFPVQPLYEKPKRVVQFGVPMLCTTIVAVLLLGFVGGLVAQTLFPAKQGPAGHEGKQGAQGPVGQAGPAGPAGNAANINLSTIGYCLNVDNVYSGGVSYVQDLSLYAPTLTNGTQSCPTGSFVPLQPSTPSSQ